MSRYVSGLASGLAVAVLVAGGSALNAQERAKPPAVAAPRANAAAPVQKTAAAPEAVAAAATPAAAPEQTTSSIAASPTSGSWRVECSGDGKVLDCRVVQQVVLRENQQLVAGLTVRVPAETKKPVMMVQMPLGILVSEAVELGVDEGKPERFNVQTCNQQGCFVGTPLAEATLAAMRSGKQLRLVFQNANKQAITVTMPLTGFGLAYDKVKG